jgi:hypothetical protein
MSSRRSPATPLANALRGEEKNPDKPGETKLPWSLHVGVVNHLLHVGVLSCPHLGAFAPLGAGPPFWGAWLQIIPRSLGVAISAHSGPTQQKMIIPRGPSPKVPRQLTRSTWRNRPSVSCTIFTSHTVGLVLNWFVGQSASESPTMRICIFRHS